MGVFASAVSGVGKWFLVFPKKSVWVFFFGFLGLGPSQEGPGFIQIRGPLWTEWTVSVKQPLTNFFLIIEII